MARKKRVGKRKAKSKPRFTVKRSPFSVPNSYSYCRSYDFPIHVGKADNSNGVYMNTDNKYQIIKLHATMNKMPDFVSDFTSLYNECQITSVKTVLVPFLKDNIPFQHQLQGANPSAANAVPNYQLFYMPENYTVDQLSLNTTAASVIDSIINQTQRKSYRLLPGKEITCWNKKPSIVIQDTVVDKVSNTSIKSKMKRVGYLNIQDHKDTLIYGQQIVCRRVDGLEMASDAVISDDSFAQMGWRAQVQVFFRCRRVQ